MEIDNKYLKEYYSHLTMDSNYSGSTQLHYTAHVLDSSGKDRLDLRVLSMLDSHICFGSLLDSFGGLCFSAKEDETIKISIRIDHDCSGRNRIFTWMTKEQLKEYIQDLIDLFPSKLSIDSADVIDIEGGLMVELLTTRKAKKIELKLLLFWLRNAIKWPYNLLVADIYKLKEKYPNVAIYDLLRVVVFGTICSHSELKYTWNENWGCWGPFITPGEIEKQIKNGKSNINGISDNGIIPDILYNDYTNSRFGVQEILEDELKFRKSIKDELGKLKRSDSAIKYEPAAFIDDEEKFKAYEKIYDFKSALKPLYM